MKQVSIKRVAEALPADASQIGAEAGRLGELARAGLPVVPSFWLTAAAYRQHVAQSGVAGALDAAYRPLAGYTRTEGTPHQSAALLDRLRRRIAVAPLPTTVAADLASAYRELAAALGATTDATDDPYPAVTVQRVPLGTGAAASIPSPTTIAGSEALADAVRDCWADLWSAAAVGGRGEHEPSPAAVACAVRVQRSVDGPAGRLALDNAAVEAPADLRPAQQHAWADLITRLTGGPWSSWIIGWAAEGDTILITAADPLPTPSRAHQPRRVRATPPPALRRRIALTLLGTLIVTVSRRVRRRGRRRD